MALLAAWPAMSSEASGTGTQVFLTRAGRTAPETIVGFINGPNELVDVRVKDVAYATGLGAFEFTITFDPIASVVNVTPGPFLGSTGRAVQCTSAIITSTSVNFSCNTTTSTPNGPVGSGKLATITFDPGGAFGSTVLHFEKMHLTDITGDVSIAHKPLDGNLLIAKCGDFVPTPLDKVITVGDLLAIILKFGTNSTQPDWNPAYDLNDSGNVDILDLLIEAQEFGRACNA
jgi:hypothetical protein